MEMLRFRYRTLPLLLVALFMVGGFLGGWLILAGKSKEWIYLVLVLVILEIAFVILKDWKMGVYFVLLWLTFEDLPRKFLGNNLMVFFGKDLLMAWGYLSFFYWMKRTGQRMFRPPFGLALAVLVWYAVIQILNPNSPSLWYGLLGLRLYFYYLPLMFMGYAMMTSERDLLRFLQFHAGVAGVVAVLGLLQVLIGPHFLNPRVPPASLGLMYIMKQVPSTGTAFTRTTSVFVSDARFAWYLFIAMVLVLGGSAYVYLRKKKHAWLFYGSFILVVLALITNGVRNTLVFAGLTWLALAVLWPWGMGKGPNRHRVVRILQKIAIVATLAFVGMFLLFPQKVGSYLAYYTATLSPWSPTSELWYRTWQYPVGNFLKAFRVFDWVFGEGLGTASLGVQYLATLFQVPTIGGVESGYGVLVVEMGLLGLILWLSWSLSLLRSSWMVCKKLQNTPHFPQAVLIWAYLFILLIPKMYLGGIGSYQNYINNVYFWLLTGILFRLPAISKQGDE